MLRNKANSLAWICGSDHPDNIGRVVQVCEYMGVVEYTSGLQKPTWRIRGNVVFWYSGQWISGREGAAPDDSLTPINDPDRAIDHAVDHDLHLPIKETV